MSQGPPQLWVAWTWRMPGRRGVPDWSSLHWWWAARTWAESALTAWCTARWCWRYSRRSYGACAECMWDPGAARRSMRICARFSWTWRTAVPIHCCLYTRRDRRPFQCSQSPSKAHCRSTNQSAKHTADRQRGNTWCPPCRNSWAWRARAKWRCR